MTLQVLDEDWKLKELSFPVMFHLIRSHATHAVLNNLIYEYQYNYDLHVKLLWKYLNRNKEQSTYNRSSGEEF
jgi:hypothetical protein